MNDEKTRFEKSFPVSWQELHRDAKALAWRLSEKGDFKAVVAITRGGLVPAAIVFGIAFKPSDPFGGIGHGWTLGTLRSLGDPNYPAILWRTIWLSAATTACERSPPPPPYASG